jgi:hypothetical protein
MPKVFRSTAKPVMVMAERIGRRAGAAATAGKKLPAAKKSSANTKATKATKTTRNKGVPAKVAKGARGMSISGSSMRGSGKAGY